MASSTNETLYIYNEDYFLSKKLKSIDIPDELKIKLNDIFTKYACFNDSANIRKPAYNKYKNKKTNFNTYKEPNEKNRLKRKTDIQIILGYLNKLTDKNYKDLSEKIINNICEENYIKIITKLFEISYKQSSYSDLYIKLYKKIILIENDDLIKSITNYILSEIENIISNKNNDLTLIDKHINKNHLDYNDFCDINKNAKNLKGKILIISKLIKNKIITLDKNFFIDTFFKYENYENEIFLELLQILNNILKLDNDKISVLQKYVDTSNFKGKMMLKFKLKDIIDNKPIKIF
tara:strand:+ start:3462 stop:4337 length:876 start_codon:yes stop_codon:yes gene_type:complete